MARVLARTWAMIILFAWIIPLTGSICLRENFARADSTLPLLFDESRTYTATEDQTNFGYRIPGTTTHEECANYIKSMLAPYTTVIDHNYTLHGVDCQNVLGILNPTFSESIVILGAHYDSRAKADRDNPGVPCLGANDGAAGVAVLLELARIFYQIRSKLKVQIWFVFFDAEDQGNNAMAGWSFAEGSYEFASNLEFFLSSLPFSTIKLMVLLDMVGGINLQFAKDGVSDGTIQDLFFQLGQGLGYTDAFPTNPDLFSSALIDDHKWFAQRGIPAVDLIINFQGNAWPYWHTTKDTMAYISMDSLDITGKTLEKFFHEYYVSAAEGGGGKNPFWGQGSDWLLTEGGAILVSCIFGACMVVGIFLAFKVYLLKKREVLKA